MVVNIVDNMCEHGDDSQATAIAGNHDASNDKKFEHNYGGDNREKCASVPQSQVQLRQKFKYVQRSVSCDYTRLCDEIDLNALLRDSDSWRKLDEANCFLDGCNCPLNAKNAATNASKLTVDSSAPRTRKISFVHFEDARLPPEDDGEVPPEPNANEAPGGGEVEVTRLRRESLYSLKEENFDDNNEPAKQSSDIAADDTGAVRDADKDVEEAVNASPNSCADTMENDRKRNQHEIKPNFFKSLFTRSMQRAGKPGKLQKSTSVIDIAGPKRNSGFLKRTLSKQTLLNTATKLKRSLSVRKLDEKLEEKKVREKFSDSKNREWAASLQSLVETDTGVSYNDLSFINYDQFDDTYNYEKYLRRWAQDNYSNGFNDDVDRRRDGGRSGGGGTIGGSKCIYRTQSMIVNKGQNPYIARHKSVSSFANYNSSRREAHHHQHHEKPLHRNNSDKISRYHLSEQQRRAAYRNHAKSLPCLVNNSTIGRHELERVPENVPAHHSPSAHADDTYSLIPQKRIELMNTLNNNEYSSVGKQCANRNRHESGLCRSCNDAKKNTRSDYVLAAPLTACDDDGGAVNVALLFPDQPDDDDQNEVRKYSSHQRRTRCANVREVNNSDRSDCAPIQKSKTLSANGSCPLTHCNSHSADSIYSIGDGNHCKSLTNFNYASGNTQVVRSRSLNHLDTLEMRQGNAMNAEEIVAGTQDREGHLKDVKSEPECITRPLLALPPEQSSTISVLPSSSASTPSPSHRRHVLSRSQKSSSECFSVNFEVGDESTYDTELFFPATRGVTLFESLSKLCELRNIDLSACDVWLYDREANQQSWLSLSQDTACLVGKHVKITANDSSNRSTTKTGLQSQSAQYQPRDSQHTQSHYFPSHSRKLSGNFRPRTSSFFSSSTEEGDYDVSKKQTKRWSTNLFGNSKDNKQSMEQLIEHLNRYSRYGVPRGQNYSLINSESQEALNRLEDDWRQIVDVTDLDERQHKQQTALWELIKTEVAYIKTLKVVTDLFLACLINLQASNILRDIDTNKLFSNISDILEANEQFWHNYLFPMVKDMRSNRRPPSLNVMCEGFLKLKECFHAYYRFCGEQSRCQHYCRENLSHNDLFTAYLAWCETQKECNRLRLMDILVQPMQRLTKYGLLLKAILKNSENEADLDNLNVMIRSVDDFVNNVNFSLKQKQDNERLKGIIARIESYDIVETKDDDLERLVRNYNQLDLTKPMLNCSVERRRHLLLEGDLKFKDSTTSKMEVHCFLLTDMLLVCKQSTKKGGATMRVIRQPYLIDKLIVTEINRETPTLACVYKNELDMAVNAFLLQNNDAKKLRSWKDGIAKAQTLYAQAKQSYLPAEESLETEYSFECPTDNDYQYCLQAPRSPLASSSRASRVSSLAHSHSGSVEMNDQSSLGSCKGISVENDNRTASISSDEGVQSLPQDQKAAASGKGSTKTHRIFHKTPNTLSVQPTYSHHLGQSLPNLSLGSPSTISCNNTLSVPSTSKNGHLLSPTHRGISYPPPSPTRGNLRRGMAINQSKNPPLIKTRHVTSSASTAGGNEFDVPVIAGVSREDGTQIEEASGNHKQRRIHRSDNRRYHTAGTIDDLKKENANIQFALQGGIPKRSSWNCLTQTGNTTKTPEENIQ